MKQSKHGLSKSSNLMHDIAKKAAVKHGSAPFTKAIGDNHRPLSSSGAAHKKPGGNLSPKKLAGVGK